jgi:nitrogen fixation/metabolism regulation signal transduction histidine kinase
LGWAIALVVLTGTALVLAFLLAVATGQQALYEEYFGWLFWVNVLVAAVLVLVIFVTTVRLGLRVAQGRFGGRLLLKIAGIFAVLAMVPGMLIYTVSYQFVSRSIESWFDVKMESALQAGLDLARPVLSARVDELMAKTRSAAEQAAEDPNGLSTLELERLREQIGSDHLAMLNAAGMVMSRVSAADAGEWPEAPGASLLTLARSERVTGRMEGIDDTADEGVSVTQTHAARVEALAVVPERSFTLTQKARYLWASTSLPADLVRNAKAVELAYTEYHDLNAGRRGLRAMYIGTLTLALILAVFGALLLSVTLAKQLAKPLILLADGMRQVARGDLSTKAVYASNDELGWLTRTFADMTEQLAEARLMVQRSVSQVEASRENLQTILDNLSAGVIVFSAAGVIEVANPAASRIVRQALSAFRGRSLSDVPGLEGFSQAVNQRFDAYFLGPEPGEREQWQDSFDLEVRGATLANGEREKTQLTLLARGATLPQGARLLVFDDITELASAQRTQAWAEVARRLAHEIKNPLTPIQLSAERLEHKLAHKLEGPDQGILSRAVATIVNQVQAMQTLVNEFRDYARLPAAQFRAVDLNELVSDVLNLYANELESGRLRCELASELPAIQGDLTQLRQVIHNLIQNGLDAVAGTPDGEVRLSTSVHLNDKSELRSVRLTVSDNGPGFPDKVLKRVFEPYVTSKTKGTGLGLAVVKKIADEHGARVRVGNLGGGELPGQEGAVVLGAQVSLSFSRFASTLGTASASDTEQA